MFQDARQKRASERILRYDFMIQNKMKLRKKMKRNYNRDFIL